MTRSKIRDDEFLYLFLYGRDQTFEGASASLQANTYQVNNKMQPVVILLQIYILRLNFLTLLS